MSSVFSLLIGAPRATRTRIVRSGCGDHRRRRWRRLYVHRRCRGLHAVASGSRERSASAGGVFLLPPTRGWRRLFPQKPDEQWQQQRQREQQLWRYFHCSTWSRRSRCCMRRAIYIAYHVGALWHVQFICWGKFPRGCQCYWPADARVAASTATEVDGSRAMRNPSFVEFGGGDSSLVERLAGSNGSASSSRRRSSRRRARRCAAAALRPWTPSARAARGACRAGSPPG